MVYSRCAQLTRLLGRVSPLAIEFAANAIAIYMCIRPYTRIKERVENIGVNDAALTRSGRALTKSSGARARITRCPLPWVVLYTLIKRAAPAYCSFHSANPWWIREKRRGIYETPVRSRVCRIIMRDDFGHTAVLDINVLSGLYIREIAIMTRERINFRELA